MPLQAQSPASRASLRRIGRFGLARGALAGPLGVLLVALIGAVFVLQGWRSRIPNFDMMTTIDDAQRLVDAGRLPDRGVLTSFFSFTPPGAAWLMAPGVWGFDDPRRFEYVGSLVTYVATLLGIFLLARMYFRSRVRSSRHHPLRFLGARHTCRHHAMAALSDSLLHRMDRGSVGEMGQGRQRPVPRGSHRGVVGRHVRVPGDGAGHSPRSCPVGPVPAQSADHPSGGGAVVHVHHLVSVPAIRAQSPLRRRQVSSTARADPLRRFHRVLV